MSNKEQNRPAENNELGILQRILFGETEKALSQHIQSVQTQFQQHVQENDARLLTLKKEHEQRMAQMAQDFHQQLNQLRQYTQEQFARVDHEKTNREALGKMLMEIGKQLVDNPGTQS